MYLEMPSHPIQKYSTSCHFNLHSWIKRKQISIQIFLSSDLYIISLYRVSVHTRPPHTACSADCRWRADVCCCQTQAWGWSNPSSSERSDPRGRSSPPPRESPNAEQTPCRSTRPEVWRFNNSANKHHTDSDLSSFDWLSAVCLTASSNYLHKHTLLTSACNWAHAAVWRDAEEVCLLKWRNHESFLLIHLKIWVICSWIGQTHRVRLCLGLHAIGPRQYNRNIVYLLSLYIQIFCICLHRPSVWETLIILAMQCGPKHTPGQYNFIFMTELAVN